MASASRCPLLAAGTGHGAEPASIWPCVVDDEPEVGAARLALAGFNAATSTAIGILNRLHIIGDGVHGTADIAGVTRCDEVLDGVVPRVVIKMVNDQRTSASRSTDDPINLFAAPVTRMRAGTNHVVQDDPMFRQFLASPQRMIGTMHELIPRLWGSVSARLPSALRGAVLHLGLDVRWRSLERCATDGAGTLNGHGSHHLSCRAGSVRSTARLSYARKGLVDANSTMIGA